MRIAIAQSGMCIGRGGSERAAIRLAHEMRSRGHEVHLMTVAADISPAYPLDPRLPVHFFDSRFFNADIEAMALGPALLREWHIDVLVSFEASWKHLLWQACCRGTGIPFVCSERSDPVLVEQVNWNRPGRLALFETSAAVHVLLPCHVASIPAHLHAKTHVIPNAAPENLAKEFPAPSERRNVILYLGRFVQLKRPQLLLRAFALLAREREFADWQLRLAGWGPDRSELLDVIAANGLQSRVFLGRPNADTSGDYAAASVYCLPTSREGFPNTVLEAMSAGLPVVGVADCPAMSAIVRHGVTGLLAMEPTPESLAAALRPLCKSEKARLRMGRGAWEECRAHYSSTVFDQWERMLTYIAEQKRA